MPVIIAPLIAALGISFRWVIATAIGMLVVRIAIALGVGIVTFKGLDFALDYFIQFLQDGMGGIGADLGSILGRMGVDVGMSMILGAFAAAAAVKAATGSMRKLVMRG